MCFSAGASFMAGTILLAAGVASIKKTKEPGLFMFASMPLLFAIQQFIEGYSWLALAHPEQYSGIRISTLGFLIFAQVIWPIWVPLSMTVIEKKGIRRTVLLLLTLCGVAVAGARVYHVLFFASQSQIEQHHIFYTVGGPEATIEIGSVLYVICTIVPSFVSSIKGMWLVGTGIFLSFLVSKLFFEEYLISTWCFFAAVISVSILKIMNDLKRSQ